MVKLRQSETAKNCIRNSSRLDSYLDFDLQYEIEIDKSKLSSFAKVLYLKELVESKVRSWIDKLLFTTEGHNRAKKFLVFQSMMPLLFIHNTNITRI